MIYTVTFNPALDYSVVVRNFEYGETNRTASENILAGGKGINVSAVLKNLGIESTALGFVAGFTGDEIERRVKASGCKCDFIHLEKGMSRINIKIKSDSETEINGRGADISSDKLEMFLQQTDRLKNGDILVLAGSIPESIPDTVYKNIMIRLAEKNIMIIVDAEKNLLLNVLENRPFLIKPNNHELGAIFNDEISDGTNKGKIIKYASVLKNRGARNVLVSLAGDGAILAAENDKFYICNAPKGKVVNSVGAGDSMVAGFIAGWTKSADYMEAFKMGVAAGSASAFSKYLADREITEEIYKSLEVTVI